jgi:hypothetical protein
MVIDFLCHELYGVYFLTFHPKRVGFETSVDLSSDKVKVTVNYKDLQPCLGSIFELYYPTPTVTVIIRGKKETFPGGSRLL